MTGTSTWSIRPAGSTTRALPTPRSRAISSRMARGLAWWPSGPSSRARRSPTTTDSALTSPSRAPAAPGAAAASSSTRRSCRASSSASALDVAAGDEILGDEDRALGRAHLGVVRDEEVLEAVPERRVGTEAADGGRHAVVLVAIEAHLGTERVVVDDDQVLRRRIVALGDERGGVLAPRALHVGLGGWPRQRHEDALGVALDDRHARAGARERERRRLNGIPDETSEYLA